MVEQREPISVSELNEYVSAYLAANPILRDIRVEGEISGFKRHSSGHLYFSLKDEQAVVRAVMFRQNAMRLSIRPADGMHVIATGYASLYTRDGSFQLYVLSMEAEGEGALYQRFIRLKKQLEAQGLFAQERKRPLPLLPKCIGIVTSGTGAALQDMLQIITRRYPGMRIEIASVRVQGAGAAEDIARGIRRMNAESDADVLIVGRGGGSMEDLWAFNERAVAEAIYESRIPVVSAVGHETDFTIADFVADLRAPTPSAAAELAVPEYVALKETVRQLTNRLHRAAEGTAASMRDMVRLRLLSPAFHRVETRLANERQAIDRAAERMERAVFRQAQEMKSNLSAMQARLTAVGPASIMARGFAFISDGDERAVTSAASLREGDRVRIHLKDGTAGAAITDINREE